MSIFIYIFIITLKVQFVSWYGVRKGMGDNNDWSVHVYDHSEENLYDVKSCFKVGRLNFELHLFLILILSTVIVETHCMQHLITMAN